jgi:TPR repeat protein
MDWYRAVACFQQLAYRGDAVGQRLLGFSLLDNAAPTTDHGAAAGYLELATNQGDADAAYTLARRCTDANYRWRVFLPRMIELYQQAADQGHMMAQFSLGDCFEKGIGCQKDLVRSANYYRMAMEQGYDDARPAYERCMKLLKKK